jgi:hypothetical protein
VPNFHNSDTAILCKTCVWHIGKLFLSSWFMIYIILLPVIKLVKYIYLLNIGKYLQ